MKIVFLCGSLAQGLDGVGDYTRRLAGELIRKGHVVAAVALNDKFLEENAEENQEDDGVFLPVFRITSTLSQKKRFAIAQNWITNYQADWVSLQFVPFSFHPKGIPLGLGSAIKKLVAGLNLHVMFHELWVGTNGKESFKMRVLGAIQKRLIKSLINTANPSCITTSISLYKRKIPATEINILPLFGNIPIVTEINNSIQSNEVLKVVHFGSFTGSIEEFKYQLVFLSKAAKYHNKGVTFVTFGEGGPFKEKALVVAKEVFGRENVVEKGRITTQEVSLQLQSADIGISRANFAMAGKSGTTLAMLEHGLPVLLRGEKSNDQGHGGTNTDSQLLFVGSDYSKIFRKLPAKSGLRNTAEIFVGFLNSNTRNSFGNTNSI